MIKTFTCILCPNGCEVEAEYEDARILSINGNSCPKGAGYVEQEIANPVRNIATSVLVENGEMPLCSVRLSGPIPKGKIMEVMAEIKKMKISAPVEIGTVVIQDILGLGCDVIATRYVEKK